MSNTQTIKIGKKTVVINNVPEDISEKELRQLVFKKLIEMGNQQEEGFRTAS